MHTYRCAWVQSQQPGSAQRGWKMGYPCMTIITSDPIIPVQGDVISLPLSACRVASSPWFPSHGLRHLSFCVSPTQRHFTASPEPPPSTFPSILPPLCSSTSAQTLRESLSPLLLSAYHSSHSALALSCKTVRNELSDKTAGAKAWRLQTPVTFWSHKLHPSAMG